MALNDPVVGEVTWRRSLTGATQADGAQDLTSSNAYETNGVEGRYRWQLQVENDGTQTTGTLTVSGKTPGASVFQEIATVDMNAPAIANWTGFYESVQVYPSSYDGSTYDVYIVAGDG